MAQQRRLLPRQYANWPGRFAIEGQPDGVWHNCRVIDMSSGGAGLDLFSVAPDDIDGRNIMLAVHLRGQIRHCTTTTDERVRVGIQFLDLGANQRRYMRSLEAVGAVW